MIKIAIGCLFVALALSACAQPADEVVLVTKVFDGDTLLLASGEKVRLIGIDCPEMYESDKLYRDARGAGEDITRIMEQGRKAWQFTRGLVEDKKVRLELDQERYDKYGRLLAYVYLDNGACLNFEIVKAGFAEPLAIAPNLRYADTFEQLYGEARRQKKGLWQ